MNRNSARKWLTDDYDYRRPRRGQMRKGLILKLGERGALVDVGLKRDGLVPQRDIERLGEKTVAELEVGQEVAARIVRPWDRDGNLILSLYQARLEKDWTRAKEFLNNDEIWRGQINGYNRGGLLVKFGRIQGFVPASHLWKLNSQRLSTDERRAKLRAYVGQELPLKAIEVERARNRLILSERLAQRQLRQQNMERLLDELLEGQVVPGTATNLVNFGAFVLLDSGVDGLIRISEIADPPPSDPREVVRRGDVLVVRILHIDSLRHRIALSLRRVSDRERGEWLTQRPHGQSVEMEEIGDSSFESEETRPMFVYAAAAGIR